MNSLSRRIILAVLTAALAAPAVALPAQASTGPYLVKDIKSPGSSNPGWLTDLNDTLMFVAGGGKGRELWRSDGTAAGTRIVKDIRSGSKGSSPEYLTAIGSVLYFSADDGIHGRELWVSDGTAVGTRMVRDINPGANPSNPRSFVELNGQVYFSAVGGTSGEDLWVSNGTSGGTKRIKDLSPGNAGVWVFGFLRLGNQLFFTIYNPNTDSARLFRTNGTKTGTKAFRDAQGDVIAGDIGPMAVVGPKLFFGYQGGLWRTTGKPSSTREIAHVDLCCESIVGVGSTAFFESNGSELWASGGTAATTRQLVAGIESDSMIAAGDRLFFFELDAQPWTSNGTPAGTQPVGKQVEREGGVAALGSIVYFNGYGDETETAQPAAFGPSANFTPSPTGTLWRSDGTAQGTYSVGGSDAHRSSFTPVGNSLYFVSDADGYGIELWRYVP